MHMYYSATGTHIRMFMCYSIASTYVILLQVHALLYYKCGCYIITNTHMVVLQVYSLKNTLVCYHIVGTQYYNYVLEQHNCVCLMLHVRVLQH